MSQQWRGILNALEIGLNDKDSSVLFVTCHTHVHTYSKYSNSTPPRHQRDHDPSREAT